MLSLIPGPRRYVTMLHNHKLRILAISIVIGFCAQYIAAVCLAWMGLQFAVSIDESFDLDDVRSSRLDTMKISSKRLATGIDRMFGYCHVLEFWMYASAPETRYASGSILLPVNLEACQMTSGIPLQSVEGWMLISDLTQNKWRDHGVASICGMSVPIIPRTVQTLLNTAVFAIIMYVVWNTVGALIRRRRVRLNQCIRCGYDVRQCTICPECGMVRSLGKS